MIVCGIDPGAAGAVAVIDDTLDVRFLTDMPMTERDYINAIRCWDFISPVFLENVHALPSQSTVAGFTYGKNVGKAELLATSMTDGTVFFVTPQTWKKAVGLSRGKEESKTEFKHKSVELARRLFPSVQDKLKISKDGRAEALLIAYYGLNVMKALDNNSK